MTTLLIADSSMGDMLRRVSEITVAAIPSAEMAAVTLLDEAGKPITAAFTSGPAPEVESAQYDAGGGPGHEAWRTQRVVRVDDLVAATADYPAFAEAATVNGVRSILSLPLAAGERAVGVLNLYARVKDGFSTDDEAVGTDLAGAAAIVLTNASDYWAAAQLAEQLTEAMRSRAVIEQAKGILMAQSPNLGPDAAFALLRRASQRENVKVRDIAQQIVDRRAP